MGKVEAGLFGCANSIQNELAKADIAASLQTELAYWEKAAPGYDQTNSLAKDGPEIVARLVELLPSERPLSILEIGAGTGEFTLPLVKAGGAVVALDQSSAMLAILQAKLEAARLSDFEILNCLWEDYISPQTGFEVVVAVNSLYRVTDLTTALQKISTVAQKRVILIRSIGGQPEPPLQFCHQFGPDRTKENKSDHLAILEALYQQGIPANLEIWPVNRVRNYNQPADLERVAWGWFKTEPTEEEKERFRLQILPAIAEPTEKGGLIYRHHHVVAIIHWQPGDWPQT